jgi:hypothetical protein
MPLGELPESERTCARCEHDDSDSQALCGGCSRAWNNGHIAGAPNDYWSETGTSVRARAEKLITELEEKLNTKYWEGIKADNERDALKTVLERIGGPDDCGCHPIRPLAACQCNSQAALAVWKEETRSMANEALMVEIERRA